MTRRLVALADGSSVRLTWDPPEVAVDGLAEAVRLCDVLAATLAERGDNVAGRPSSRKWVLDMEALLRLDGRDPHRVELVIRWLHAGADDVARFWRAHVRSPGKLRAKWTQMAEQYDAQVKRGQRASTPVSDEAAAIVAQQYRDAEARRAPALGEAAS